MEQNLAPFRLGTRQKIARIGSVPMVAGETRTVRLPSVGFLSSIFLRATGSIQFNDLSGPVASSPNRPFALIKNLLLQINSGRQILVNASGADLHFLSYYRYGKGPSAGYSGFMAHTYQWVLGTDFTSFTFCIEIPVAISDGQNFHIGLINLQAPELECTLDLTFANNNDLGGGGFSLQNGQVELYYRYYEVPDPSKVMLPPPVIHKILAFPSAVLSSQGQTTVEIPRGGRLMRLFHYTLDQDNIVDPGIQRVRLIINKTYELYDIPKWLHHFEQVLHGAEAQYGFTEEMHPEIVGFNLQKAWNIKEESDLRDSIDTEKATTVDSVVDISTDKQAQNIRLITVREILQFPVA